MIGKIAIKYTMENRNIFIASLFFMVRNKTIA